MMIKLYDLGMKKELEFSVPKSIKMMFCLKKVLNKNIYFYIRFPLAFLAFK